MFLREIEIRNFGIIREAHLAFPKSNPVIGLVGRYEAEEDSGRSNRAGKSTFIEAMEYLLFGKARTRHHGKLINRTARAAGEGMTVRGVYELQDGTPIEIVRSRTNDGKGTASVTGFEGSGWNEVNERIAELIGFSHDEFRNTAYFSQGDIHAFMSSAPKEKRALLLDWLNQRRWEVRAEFAKQRAEEADGKVRQLTGTLEALPEPEGDPEELDAKAEEAEDAADITREEIKTVRATLAALEVESAEVINQVNLRAEKKRLIGSIEAAERALEKAEGKQREKSILDDSLKEKRDLLRDLLQGESKAQIETLRDEYNRARIEHEEAVRKHTTVVKTAGVCPVLGESCDRVDATQTAHFKDLVESAGSVLRKAKADYEGTRDRHKEDVARLEKDVAQIERQIEALGNTDTVGFERMLDRLDGELESLKGRLKEGIREQATIDQEKREASEEMEKLNRALGRFKAEAKSHQQAAQRAREYAERKARIRDAVEDLRIDLGAWQYCAYMFGDRGIPNEYIKGAFDTLEADVNYILNRMNCGLSVEFKPFRETKNFEPACLACGREFKPRERKCADCSEPRQRKRVEQLVLIIHDAAEGTQSDFSLDSGGGQTLISFAVRLALLFFKVRQGDGETPPIVLDEIAGMLDPVNRQAVIDVILHILTEEYGIKQIFWISHNEEILDLIEHALAVTRAGASSTVDWL